MDGNNISSIEEVWQHESGLGIGPTYLDLDVGAADLNYDRNGVYASRKYARPRLRLAALLHLCTQNLDGLFKSLNNVAHIETCTLLIRCDLSAHVFVLQ